jgi:circadian clock protein KaiB
VTAEIEPPTPFVAAAAALAEADQVDAGPTYDLTLFVSGASGLSSTAIANASALCEAHLAGRYVLAVVDVHADSSSVIASNVLAAPTLVRNLPLPVRKIVGDLTDTDRVLRALEVQEPGAAPWAAPER